MARKKSKTQTKPASKKKSLRRASAATPASKKSVSPEFDDIELLNAHRYPDSLSPAKLARIRKSKAAQERLKQLLKEMPSNKAAKERDISAILQSDPEETENEKDEKYEYESGSMEKADSDNVPSSKIGKFFRRHES